MKNHNNELPSDKYKPQAQSVHVASVGDEEPDKPDSQLPIIIWWTGRLFIRKEMSVLNCGINKCVITKKRKYLSNPRTRGFIFYGTDFAPDDLPLPRHKQHEWAFVHEESPMNNYMFSHAVTLKYFNHSSTFRRESDLPITTHSLSSLEYLTERKPVNIATKNQYRKKGFAPLLYVHSHCDVASDRDSYIRELMKFIDVDSYGSCVHNKDLPKTLSDPVESMFADGFLDIISRYKFHLAFENAICDDYITEKLFRVFHVGSVPVYFGSSTAQDWSPAKRAIIMVQDFETPEKLALFIKELDTDDNRYEEYLQYKYTGIDNDYLTNVMTSRTWGLNHDYLPFFLDRFECHLCDKVSERIRAEKEHEKDSNMPLMPDRTVPYSHMGCPQPEPAVNSVDK